VCYQDEIPIGARSDDAIRGTAKFVEEIVRNCEFLRSEVAVGVVAGNLRWRQWAPIRPRLAHCTLPSS
jgi:hypothetical protein